MKSLEKFARVLKLASVCFVAMLIFSSCEEDKNDTNNGVYKKTTLINEGFESYAAGTFPSNGGWIIYNSSHLSEAMIVDNVSKSGTKSLFLKGTLAYTGCCYKLFNGTGDFITAEFDFYTDEVRAADGGMFLSIMNNGIIENVVHIPFMNGILWAQDEVGEYWKSSKVYESKEWHHFKAVLNNKTHTYKVYVDGELLSFTYNSVAKSELPAVCSEIPEMIGLMGQGNYGNVNYDDILVYSEINVK